MFNYDNLLFVYEKLGQLSNTINSYIYWPSAKAESTAGDNDKSEQLLKSLADKVNTLETNVTQLKKADKTFNGKLTIIDKKLEYVRVMSDEIQKLANSIEMLMSADEDRKAEIRKLSAKLEDHDRVCSTYDPATLEGQAKEMYGLICSKVGHDE
jgi:chromosome segregation ATPase